VPPKPRVGWMQGAAGIAAFLFRVSARRAGRPTADPVPRMDTWRALGTPRGADA
jgi:hypothetical protein